MKIKNFTYFWKSASPFSQWHDRGFVVDGIEFKTAEHWMMHGKAKLFGDEKHMQKAIEANHPRDAKSVGRAVKGFSKPVWDANARNIVYQGNYYKFTQNLDLKQQLISTSGTRLVEAAPNDEVWGIGLSEKEARRVGEKNWKGTNWLGEVLDAVREDVIMDEFKQDRFLKIKN
jgi:ribA/ribD-fused uncharacterized protein